ncbi:MAG TPA: peptidylprolyl isomerase [Thermoguttaceae bacterium]|nr:peptidylprolyl isomerase [Thermoguttaceae bacterium]
MAGLVCILAATCREGRLSAGEQPSSEEQEEQVVVATVGGEPVFARDVQRLLNKAVQRQNVNPAVLPVFQAQVLSEAVDRRLVLAYARRTKSGPSESEIDTAVAELTARSRAQGGSLEAYLAEASLTDAELRRRITWSLVWERYLAKYVTEERLAAHFEAHRRQFEGTQLSVSHILLRPKANDDSQAISRLVKQAEAIRAEIISGKLSFADAASKHSAGPSAAEGGRLGFIGRRGPMVESFSRAAFSLEVGQVSQPVTTRFGVHLIRCDEIRPGSKQLADVRKEVEAALARELLDKLARFEQKQTPVEYTGKWPHFKPGTRELIVP